MEKNEVGCKLEPIEYKKINKNEYKVLSISDIEKLGPIATGVLEVLHNVIKPGGSGLYMVNTHGGTLFHSAIKDGFIGGMRAATGGVGQATLSPVYFNPVILGIVLSLEIILSKMDQIKGVCDEILNYMVSKDNSMLSNYYNELFQIYDEYKIYFNNDKIVGEYITKLSKIELDSGNLIKHYEDLIITELEKHKINISEYSIDKDLSKVKFYYYNYELSIFNKLFSQFLLIIIEHKFDHDTIEKYVNMIKEIEKQKEELKVKCISNFNNKLNSDLCSIGNNIADSTLDKIPPIHWLNKCIKKRFPITDNAKKDVGKVENLFASDKELNTDAFKTNVKYIDNVYNDNIEILIDNENIYIK